MSAIDGPHASVYTVSMKANVIHAQEGPMGRRERVTDTPRRQAYYCRTSPSPTPSLRLSTRTTELFTTHTNTLNPVSPYLAMSTSSSSGWRLQSTPRHQVPACAPQAARNSSGAAPAAMACGCGQERGMWTGCVAAWGVGSWVYSREGTVKGLSGDGCTVGSGG